MFCTLQDVLTELFESDAVSRADWAYASGASTATISLWVEHGVVPPPDQLAGIWLLVNQDDRLPPSLKDRLKHVLEQPIELVTDAPNRVEGRTLFAYMLGPCRDAAIAMLATLPAVDQEVLLIEFGERIRERLGIRHA